MERQASDALRPQLLLDVKIARNAKAAAPHIPYHPYFCPKHAERTPTWHDGGGDYVYGDNDLWQEHLLHIVVSTATLEVATWNCQKKLLVSALLQLETEA